jgi:hypothetical protein
MKLRMLFILLATLAPATRVGTITTAAGDGQAGYSGDGGLATQARLNLPFHCDIDARGNLYVAEAGNHCIRKMNLKTGVISTVAGNGQKGYSGDGGPATAATMNEPYSVVVNARGDLFIADRLNAVVRKVDGKTGIISTVVGNGQKGYGGDGGPGTAAMLREPTDCWLVGKGRDAALLIADESDWRIRRLDLERGTITTFAGIGRPPGRVSRPFPGEGGPATQAVLGGGRAVCTDRKGNIYLCAGNAIRKVDTSGVITTLAGTGATGYDGDGGDAHQATFRGPRGVRCDRQGNLIIVDGDNHAIRKLDVKTNLITTICGGRRGPQGDGGDATQAGLGQPHGTVFDTQGNLYVADTLNHRVRKLSWR